MTVGISSAPEGGNFEGLGVLKGPASLFKPPFFLLFANPGHYVACLALDTPPQTIIEMGRLAGPSSFLRSKTILSHICEKERRAKSGEDI